MTNTNERTIYGPGHKDHHIWCNFWRSTPAPCKQCDQLYASYPYESESEAGRLAAKHFPEAILR